MKRRKAGKGIEEQRQERRQPESAESKRSSAIVDFLGQGQQPPRKPRKKKATVFAIADPPAQRSSAVAVGGQEKGAVEHAEARPKERRVLADLSQPSTTTTSALSPSATQLSPPLSPAPACGPKRQQFSPTTELRISNAVRRIKEARVRKETEDATRRRREAQAGTEEEALRQADKNEERQNGKKKKPSTVRRFGEDDGEEELPVPLITSASALSTATIATNITTHRLRLLPTVIDKANGSARVLVSPALSDPGPGAHPALLGSSEMGCSSSGELLPDSSSEPSVSGSSAHHASAEHWRDGSSPRVFIESALRACYPALEHGSRMIVGLGGSHLTGVRYAKHMLELLNVISSLLEQAQSTLLPDWRRPLKQSGSRIPFNGLRPALNDFHGVAHIQKLSRPLEVLLATYPFIADSQLGYSDRLKIHGALNNVMKTTAGLQEFFAWMALCSERAASTESHRSPPSDDRTLSFEAASPIGPAQAPLGEESPSRGRLAYAPEPEDRPTSKNEDVEMHTAATGCSASSVSFSISHDDTAPLDQDGRSTIVVESRRVKRSETPSRLSSDQIIKRETPPSPTSSELWHNPSILLALTTIKRELPPSPTSSDLWGDRASSLPLGSTAVSEEASNGRDVKQEPPFPLTSSELSVDWISPHPSASTMISAEDGDSLSSSWAVKREPPRLPTSSELPSIQLFPCSSRAPAVSQDQVVSQSALYQPPNPATRLASPPSSSSSFKTRRLLGALPFSSQDSKPSGKSALIPRRATALSIMAVTDPTNTSSSSVDQRVVGPGSASHVSASLPLKEKSPSPCWQAINRGEDLCEDVEDVLAGMAMEEEDEEDEEPEVDELESD